MTASRAGVTNRRAASELVASAPRRPRGCSGGRPLWLWSRARSTRSQRRAETQQQPRTTRTLTAAAALPLHILRADHIRTASILPTPLLLETHAVLHLLDRDDEFFARNVTVAVHIDRGYNCADGRAV